MSVHTVTGMALEQTGLIVMARVVGHGGFPITAATISTIHYEVGYRDTPLEVRSPTDSATEAAPVRTSNEAVEITPVSSVVYDSLQKGPSSVVTAAAPANADSTFLYVWPLTADLPKGKLLTFPAGAATLTKTARVGDFKLTAIVTGTIDAAQRSTTGVPVKPPQSPWQVDDLGYNFLYKLPAAQLAAIPIALYPAPRYYIATFKFTPTVGDPFGIRYQIETHHWEYGKWGAA